MSLIEARNLEVGYQIPGNGIFAKSRMLPIVRCLWRWNPAAPLAWWAKAAAANPPLAGLFCG